MYPTNPAAQILPVVERIAPDRLADVFWRAVALHPRIETDREDQLKSSYIGYECIVVAVQPRGGRRTLRANKCLPPCTRCPNGPARRFQRQRDHGQGLHRPPGCCRSHRIPDHAFRTPPTEPGSSDKAVASRSTGHTFRSPMATAVALYRCATRRLIALRSCRDRCTGTLNINPSHL